jgi:hypothetical protein
LPHASESELTSHIAPPKEAQAGTPGQVPIGVDRQPRIALQEGAWASTAGFPDIQASDG